MRRRILIVPGLALAVAAGCGDGGKKKGALGATCEDSEACASGLCYQSVCLDPESDDDGDQLVNRVEAGLGTDTDAIDTDGDGVEDGDEVDASLANLDSDSDGKPDALESAVADADLDCVVDQDDAHDDDPGEGEGAPAVATACPSVGVCAAAGATLAVACPDGLDQPVCVFGGVAGYSAYDVDCDGLDDDCDGVADEDATCTTLPADCESVGSTVDGSYEIDPDGPGGGDPFTAQCRFGIAGGTWVRYDAGVAAAIAAAAPTGPRQYLYTYEGSWYRSPITTKAWSWQAGDGIDGDWIYYDAAQLYLGTYPCDDIGSQGVGLACVSQQESGFSIAADPPPDPATGTVTIDEDGSPRVFGATSAGAVGVWVRFVDCPPDAGQLLGDASFSAFEAGGACWYAAGEGEPLRHFAFSQDVPSDGSPPSLAATNPTVDNELWTVQLIQRGLALFSGRTYLVTFWAKAQAPRTIVSLVHTETLDTTYAYQVIDIGTQWQPYTYWFTPAPGQSTVVGMFELQFGQASKETVWVDEVSVVDFGPDLCRGVGGVVDGAFTLPALMCWELFNAPGNPTRASYDLVDRRPGGDGPALRLVANATETSSDAGIIQRAFDLVGGQTYRLHYWVKAESPMDVGFGLTTDLAGVAGGFLPATTEWVELTANFTTPRDVPSFGYTLQFQIGNPQGHAVWLDDIWIEETQVVR